MSAIHLTTFISAPIDRVFNLSRNLAVYRYVFNSRKEKFSASASGSLLTQGESVSIVAKHAGKERLLTLRITTFDKPFTFVEEQVKGDLVNFKHEHHFKEVQNGTIVIDLIDYGLPRDFVGRYLGRLYLKKYLEDLVHRRNEVIRSYAESEKWRAVLS